METAVEKTVLQSYPVYKDSGVDWLGEIPESWNSLSNKYIFKLNKIQVGKKSSTYDLLSLTLNGVIKRDMENPSGKFPAEFDTYQEVKKGDFIFCLFDVEETPRTVGLSDFDGMITGAYTVMQADNSFNKSFLYYFYLNLDANKRMKPLYTGLRNTISKDNFFSFKTFVPPIKEQTAIANFLNDKTAKIDHAIAIKQKQIELLKERKQILIYKAVTKGLNSRTKLIDSKIDWLNDVPKHWEIKKLKYIFKIKKNIIGELGHKVLSITQTGIKIKNIESNEGQLSMDYSKYQIVNIGDFAMNHMDLLTGFVDISLFNGVMSPDYRVFNLIKKNCYDKFMLLLLQLCYKNKAFYANGQGVSMLGRWRLPSDNFNNFFFPVPPKDEQVEIVRHIETLNSKIATAISLKEQEIEKLKEYKMSLIDGVVTGKIKVC